MMQSQDLSHRRAWELIPLLVNGRLDADERDEALTHLRNCADCRDEYAFQIRLQVGMLAESDRTQDPHSALRALLDGIDEEDRVAVPGDSLHRRASFASRAGAGRVRRRHARPLLAAVVVQSVALALLGALLLARSDGPARVSADAPNAAPYQTLSRSDEWSGVAMIRLVPAPDLTIADLQTLLKHSNLRIVASNPDNSIYALGANASVSDPVRAAALTASALAHLRTHRGVLLAEPIAPAISDSTHLE